jgi:predicted transcriptional regulator
MKYRSRTEIVGIILEIASQGATKTKIMYDAYLSYTQLTEYLSFLTENKLIKRQEGTELYRLTEKGHRFYLKCREIDEMIETKYTHVDSFDGKNSSHHDHSHKTR